MNLYRLWIEGCLHPTRAFEELKTRPAPQWGFWVVVNFNGLIAVTILIRYLIGDTPLMASWLTFLPDDKYLLAEIFFLPPLRVMLWLAGAAVIHTCLRLTHQRTNFDQMLNIGGLGYLVVMPFILITDWVFIAFGRYGIAQYVHSFAPLWGLLLNCFALRSFFGTPVRLTILWTLVSTLLTLPFLAILAR